LQLNADCISIMLYLIQSNVAVPYDNRLKSLALCRKWEYNVNITDFFIFSYMVIRLMELLRRVNTENTGSLDARNFCSVHSSDITNSDINFPLQNL
jgi:hypothetical protein